MTIDKITQVSAAITTFLEDKDSSADNKCEFRLGVNADKCEQVLTRYSKQVAKIDEKHILKDADGKSVPNMVDSGKKDDEGKTIMKQYGFKVKDPVAYQKEIDELKEEEIEMDFRTIELSRLESAKGLTGLLYKCCTVFIVEDK